MLLMTISELADQLGVEYATAAAVVKLMESKGKAKFDSKRPASGGKGKPSSVYQLEKTFTISLEKQAA